MAKGDMKALADARKARRDRAALVGWISTPDGGFISGACSIRKERHGSHWVLHGPGLPPTGKAFRTAQDAVDFANGKEAK